MALADLLAGLRADVVDVTTLDERVAGWEIIVLVPKDEEEQNEPYKPSA